METFGKVGECLYYSLNSYRYSFFRQEAIARTDVALKHNLEPVVNDFFFLMTQEPSSYFPRVSSWYEK